MSECTVNDCGKSGQGLLCSTHRWRMKHWGSYEKPVSYRKRSDDVLVKRPDSVIVGDRWYMTIHKRMVYRYGKANKCEMVTCNRKSNSYHWANLTGLYLPDRDDWKMMCVSCHRLYDYDNKCKRGHQLLGDNLYIAPKTLIRGCKICRREAAIRARKKYAIT